MSPLRFHRADVPQGRTLQALWLATLTRVPSSGRTPRLTLS